MIRNRAGFVAALAQLIAFVAATASAQETLVQNPLHLLSYSPVFPAQAGPGSAAVSESSGAATLSLPIETPPGRAGFAPTLALVYSSQAGDGVFGMGWSLPTSEIRITTRFGLQGFHTSQHDVYPFELDGQLLIASGSAGHYHTRTESFLDAHLRSDGSWEVAYPNGQKARYGLTSNARVLQSADTVRWLLEEQEDVNGNKIFFEYDTPAGTKMPYPLAIRWGGDTEATSPRSIEIDYEDRADVLVRFIAGAKTEVTKRASAINTKIGDETVRVLHLDYATDPGRARLVRARLQGFQPGESGSSTWLPPQEFEYFSSPDGSDRSDTYQPPVPVEWGPSDEPARDNGVRFADVNGDGLVDVVRAFLEADGDTRHAVYLNNGNGWGTAADGSWSASLANLNVAARKLEFTALQGCYVDQIVVGNGQPESAVFFGFERPMHAPEGSSPLVVLARPSTHLVDINGDGLPDIVGSYAVGGGETCEGQELQAVPIRYVHLNTGSGWEPNSNAAYANSLPPFTSYEFGENVSPGEMTDWRVEDGCLTGATPPQGHCAGGWVRNVDLGVRFVELTGDGLLDLIADHGDESFPVGGFAMGAYWNNGQAFTRKPAFDLGGLEIVRHYRKQLSADAGVRFVDLNADGFTDLVKTPAPKDGGGAESHEVWMNRGDGWCPDSTASCAFATRFRLPVAAVREFALLGGEFIAFDNQLSFADLDSDGYPDLIRTDGTIAGGKVAWGMDPSGTSTAWGGSNPWPTPEGMLTAVTYDGVKPGGQGVRVVDVDGNGSPDFLRSHASTPSGSSYHERVTILEPTMFGDRLRFYENGQGGLLEFVYEGAANQTKENLEAALAAGLAVPNPGGVRRGSSAPVVSERTVFNVDDVEGRTWKYFYARPRFDKDLRESYGFAGVQVHRPDGARVRTAYFQHPGIAGRRNRTQLIERVGSTETLLHETTETWQALAGGSAVGGSVSGSLVPRLTSMRRATLYGGATESAEQENLFYNDSYGYNFVAGTIRIRNATTLVVARTPYAISISAGVKGLPGRETASDFGGSLLRDISYEYFPTHGRLKKRTMVSCPVGLPNCTQPPVSEEFTYDSSGNLRSSIDRGGRTSEYCYDGDATYESGGACPSSGSSPAHAVLIGIRDPLGEETRIAPDLATGSPFQITRFNGDRVRYERDGLGRPLRLFFQPWRAGQSFVERKHEEWVYFDDPAAAGNDADRAYVEHVRFADAGVSSIREALYSDGLGGIAKRVAPGKEPSQWIGEAIGRDYAGRPVWETFPEPCGDLHCGSLPTAPPTSGVVPPNIQTTFDLLGRQKQVSTPDGPFGFSYGFEYVTQPTGGSVGLESVLVTDPKANQTLRYHDHGQVRAVRECNGACGTASPTTWYRYQATGELTEVYDARGLSTPSMLRQHSMLGQVLTVTDAATGLSSFVYNSSGTLAARTNAREQTIVYLYDDLDRVTDIFRDEDQPAPPAEDPVPSAVLTYDPVTRQLAQVVEDGLYDYEQRYEYDEFSRVAKDTLEVEGKTLVSKFEYDFLGRMTRYYSPVKELGILYTYAGPYLDRVREVRENPNSMGTLFQWVSKIDYDTRGRPMTVFPVDSSAPYPIHFGYDDAKQRLTDVWWQSGTLFDLHYDYDLAGNVSKVEDQHTGGGPNGTIDFDHDGNNRLKWWEWLGEPGEPTGKRYLKYDVVGNLVGRDVPSPSAENQTFADPTNPFALTGATRNGETFAYEYDADGNQKSRTRGTATQHRSYDSEGRLRCVGTAPDQCDIQRFTYRFDGQRLTERIGGRTRILAPEGFTLEVEPDATLTGRFYGHVFGEPFSETTQTNAQLRLEATTGSGIWEVPDWLLPLLAGIGVLGLLLALLHLGLLEGMRANPVSAAIALVLSIVLVPAPVAYSITPPLPGGGTTTRRLLLGDQIGSTLLVVALSETPTVVSRKVFDPFGRRIQEEGTPEPTVQRFGGHRYVDDVALYDFNARWYDAEAGRFLQGDPVVESLEDPGTLNAYSYVRNNPTTRVDPTGLLSIPLGEDTVPLPNPEQFAANRGNSFIAQVLSQPSQAPLSLTFQVPGLAALQSPGAAAAAGSQAPLSTWFGLPEYYEGPFGMVVPNAEAQQAFGLGIAAGGLAGLLMAAPEAALVVASRYPNAYLTALAIFGGNPKLFSNRFPGDQLVSPKLVELSKVTSGRLSLTLNYVVTATGKLVLGRTNVGGHIDLAGGAPVRAAGVVRFVNGAVHSINNASGHYRTSGLSARAAAEAAFGTAGKYSEIY